MKTMKTLWYWVGLVVVAVVAFGGGIYYVAAGNQIPSFISKLAHGVGYYDSTVGTVATNNGSTLTITLPGGSTQAFTITPQTPVIESPAPMPKSTRDLIAGTSVLVIYSSSDSSAGQVQIIPPSTTPAAQ